MIPPRSSVAAAVGRTPLIKLRRASEETGCTILGKAEFMNPGASVKDRAALGILTEAMDSGRLRPGGTVVEGTAGNTGIGLTVLGNALGLRTVIVIPNTQSQEKKDTLRMLGAEVVEVPAVPYRDANNYVKYSARLAEALAATEPGGAVWANQFDNTANRDIHTATTAEEIWADTEGKVDGFVAAVGSGGTLGGVSRGLKAKREGIAIALADPPGSALYSYFTTGEFKAEGTSVTEGIGQGRITKNLEGAAIDMAYRIPDEEALAHRLRPHGRGGFVLRCIDGGQRRRRHAARPRAGAGSYDRDDPVRQRYALPVAAVQPGVSGGQVLARARLAVASGAPTSVGIQRHVTRIEPEEGAAILAGIATFAYVATGAAGELAPINVHETAREGNVLESAKNWIVSTDWLASHLDAPDLVVFDASWHLPTAGRDPKAEYLEGHIPGAMFFDIDDLTDEKSSLPHMLPSTVKFASRMKKMGIGDGMRIVVYDTLGMFSAPRAWWTFRAMGHEDVAVLDGGLKKWKAEGRELEDGPARKRTERHFTPLMNASLIRDMDDVKKIIAKRSAQLVDARPAGRFEGTEPEPRPGLRGGHLPGARNVPSQSLINADGTLKSTPELAKIFADAGIDPKHPVVTSCGSGVTASILSLALAVLGQTNAAVYDGSWAEWGAENGPAIETGPARELTQ